MFNVSNQMVKLRVKTYLAGAISAGLIQPIDGVMKWWSHGVHERRAMSRKKRSVPGSRLEQNNAQVKVRAV